MTLIVDNIATGLVLSLFAVVLLYKLVDRILRIPKLPYDKNSQRFVLITGCDSGFGFESARRLDAVGCRVFATCLSEAGENELKKRCSDKLMTVRMDVTDQESIRKAFEFVTNRLPHGRGLWGLINNAGAGSRSIGPCEWLILDDYRGCMEVNFFGVIAVTSTFLPLVKRERGRIVNTSSVLGRLATAITSAPYTASKFAVEGYSDILRRTVQWYGVSVHTVEPGPHPTRLFLDNEPGVRNAWRQAPEHVRNQFGKNYVHTLIEYKEKTSTTSNKISGVVDVYEHALLARFPRARYLVGSGLMTALIIEALPEWISDRIWRRIDRFPVPDYR
jgi:NAD(P)-dependent dehydrogenase (short-subunit alcohol dehydrogenase family)